MTERTAGCCPAGRRDSRSLIYYDPHLSDGLAYVRQFRSLNVLDDYTCERLVIEGRYVIRVRLPNVRVGGQGQLRSGRRYVCNQNFSTTQHNSER
jgi:hypothetical protein